MFEDLTNFSETSKEMLVDELEVREERLGDRSTCAFSIVFAP